MCVCGDPIVSNTVCNGAEADQSNPNLQVAWQRLQPRLSPADNNSNQVACLDTRCAWHESRLGSPGVTILLGKQLRGFRETDWKATYLNQYPPTPHPPSFVCLWGARLTDLCPQQQMTFGLFKYGISLPHSRLLRRCSVSHPKYSPLRVQKATFFIPGIKHHYHKGTIKSKTMTFYFFADSAFAGITQLPGTWTMTGGFVWSGSHLQTLPPPPHPNKHSIAGCLAVFPMPCLETRAGPRHHTDGKQRTLHKQLPAPLARCNFWGLDRQIPWCFCTSRCTSSVSRQSRNRKLKTADETTHQPPKKWITLFELLFMGYNC